MGCFCIATEQALAIATVTDTLRALAAAISFSGRTLAVAWKVGRVRAAVMEWATAFSIEVIGRPWPGTCTCGSWCATSAMEGRARATSAETITPVGLEALTWFKSTPVWAAILRAYGLA